MEQILTGHQSCFKIFTIPVPVRLWKDLSADASSKTEDLLRVSARYYVNQIIKFWTILKRTSGVTASSWWKCRDCTCASHKMEKPLKIWFHLHTERTLHEPKANHWSGRSEDLDNIHSLYRVDQWDWEDRNKEERNMDTRWYLVRAIAVFSIKQKNTWRSVRYIENVIPKGIAMVKLLKELVDMSDLTPKNVNTKLLKKRVLYFLTFMGWKKP